MVPRVKRTLVEALNLDLEPDAIDPKARIFEAAGESPSTPGLGLDSIDALEIVVALEREFDIIIEDTDMGPELFSTVEAMASFVERKLAERGGSDSSRAGG